MIVNRSRPATRVKLDIFLIISSLSWSSQGIWIDILSALRQVISLVRLILPVREAAVVSCAFVVVVSLPLKT